MKVNLSTEKLEYFNLKIVDNVSINYDISSYPSCQLSVVCTEAQKIELEEKIDSDLLPLFLGYFKPESISFIETPPYLNLANIYKATISFKYFLIDALDATFNLIPKGAYQDFTKPMERGILTSSIKNVTLEAPLSNYRFIDVRQNPNLLTTANQEISYLMSTYGLVINQSKLRKGIISLVPYGTKLSEILIPSDEILDRQVSQINSLNYQIPPTIIWRDTFTVNQTNQLSSVSTNNLTTTCFDFTEIATTVNTDFNITLSSVESNPYHSLNPFVNEEISPEINTEIVGIKQLDKINHNDYFTLKDFRKYNNSFLEQFSEDLNLTFGRTTFSSINFNNGNSLEENNNYSAFNSIFTEPILNDPNPPIYLFRVRYKNTFLTIESGDVDLSPDTKYTNEQKFDDLATNGGGTKQRIKQVFKNGQPLTTEVTTYGYVFKGFNEENIEKNWEIIERKTTTFKYATHKFKGWGEQYLTPDGYEVTGWKLYQGEPPRLENDEKLEDYFKGTIGSSDEEVVFDYENRFKVIKIPISETQTIKRESLTFLPEYKKPNPELRTPLEYVSEIETFSDTRTPLIINGNTYLVGHLNRTTIKTEFTYISQDTQERTHQHRVTTTELSMTSVAGKIGNRLRKTTFEDRTGSPEAVQYTPLENPNTKPSFQNKDNDLSGVNGKKELIIYTKNQRYLYNEKIKRIYSENFKQIKNQNDAFKAFLSNEHLNLIRGNFNKTITILGNANIYPTDTIKYRWKNKTEGGLVLSVNHNLQVLPNNICRWLTTITFSDYSFNKFKEKFETRTRNYSD